jgi:hypothetical protein
MSTISRVNSKAESLPNCHTIHITSSIVMLVPEAFLDFLQGGDEAG